VHVAHLAQRADQLGLGAGDAGVAEEREPRRQVETVAPRAQALERVDVAVVGWRGADAGDEPAPQLGLPAQVVGERGAGPVGVTSLAPVGDQLRALDGVVAEEARHPACDGVAAGRALVGRVTTAEVPGQGLEAGLAHGVVDDLEQRPGERVGVPRVGVLHAEQERDQRAGRHEVDAGAHAVTAAGTDAQPVRQALGEPALDTARRHDHDLAGERVGQRSDQQVRQAVGQRVGALGGVQVEGHGRHPMSGCRHPAAARQRAMK
jgi:hypothetical protein